MKFTDNQQLAIDTARTFIERKVAPIASRIDELEEFPLDNIREMGRLGLLGLPYPDQWGGSGLDYLTYSTIIREIAAVCASTAMTVVAHSTLTAFPIFEFGTDSQKEAYLKPLFSGDKIGAFALTEPSAGSDMFSMETKAVAKGDNYILNGSKIFVTNANVSDVFVVAAKTAPDRNLMGLSVFVLEKGMPGFTVSGRQDKKLGMRGSDTGELVFDDAVVPRRNLLGKPSMGLKVLHETLTTARIGMAAIALGISMGAREHCLRHVRERKQFGKHLYHFQSIKNMLADMTMYIEACKLLLEHAAAMKDRGEGITQASAEAKLFASDMAMNVTRNAIQIFGGSGYCCELPLERFFRDAKLTEIGDGTSEILRVIIADEAVKKASRE